MRSDAHAWGPYETDLWWEFSLSQNSLCTKEGSDSFIVYKKKNLSFERRKLQQPHLQQLEKNSHYYNERKKASHIVSQIL